MIRCAVEGGLLGSASGAPAPTPRRPAREGTGGRTNDPPVAYLGGDEAERRRRFAEKKGAGGERVEFWRREGCAGVGRHRGGAGRQNDRAIKDSMDPMRRFFSSTGVRGKVVAPSRASPEDTALCAGRQREGGEETKASASGERRRGTDETLTKRGHGLTLSLRASSSKLGSGIAGSESDPTSSSTSSSSSSSNSSSGSEYAGGHHRRRKRKKRRRSWGVRPCQGRREDDDPPSRRRVQSGKTHRRPSSLLSGDESSTTRTERDGSDNREKERMMRREHKSRRRRRRGDQKGELHDDPGVDGDGRYRRRRKSRLERGESSHHGEVVVAAAAPLEEMRRRRAERERREAGRESGLQPRQGVASTDDRRRHYQDQYNPELSRW